MKIGIFGGSFNPPHKMHLDITLNLVAKGYVDKIVFVPTSNYYLKEGLISDSDRYKMISLMIEDYQYLSISDYEFDKLTYTYQTLDYFQKQYPNDKIYFICGSDNLKTLDTWREYKTILERFNILVIQREENIDYLIQKYEDYKSHIEIAKIDYCGISSTEIRSILKNKNYENNIIDKIDLKVLKYIEDKGLY